MSNVVEQLQNFLAQACKEPVSMSDDIVEEFGELCKSALRKQFTEEREKKFFEEGQFLFFDYSLFHRVVNNDEVGRMVLLLLLPLK